MERSQGFLAVAEAVRRIRHDRKLLLQAVEGRSESELRAAYHVAGGPLGDFCESLHDLVAHVLMWDEINLAVLAEASRGRRHWSLDPRWESPAAGRALNLGGVTGGRSIPSDLLIHRFTVTTASLVAELDGTETMRWETHPFESELTVGALAEYVMTVPGRLPYWHAAIHLGADHLMEPPPVGAAG